MRLTEILDDQPLIISVLKKKLETDEPVSLKLANGMRFYLQAIELFSGDSRHTNGDAHWILHFMTRTGNTTDRVVTAENADDWELSRDIFKELRLELTRPN